VAVCSAPSHLRSSYKRYLSNQIRAAFGFESIPVRMHFKQRASRSE
jgi:predicted GTPase